MSDQIKKTENNTTEVTEKKDKAQILEELQEMLTSTQIHYVLASESLWDAQELLKELIKEYPTRGLQKYESEFSEQRELLKYLVDWVIKLRALALNEEMFGIIPGSNEEKEYLKHKNKEKSLKELCHILEKKGIETGINDFQEPIYSITIFFPNLHGVRVTYGSEVYQYISDEEDFLLVEGMRENEEEWKSVCDALTFYEEDWKTECNIPVEDNVIRCSNLEEVMEVIEKVEGLPHIFAEKIL